MQASVRVLSIEYWEECRRMDRNPLAVTREEQQQLTKALAVSQEQ